MKRHQRLSILAALILASCDQGTPASHPVTIDVDTGVNVVRPSTQYALLSAFTAALPCNGAALAWSIREQGVGWTATDGSITQAGIWTSPACGSPWMGGQLHIDAACAATGLTATATIATVPETVSGVQVAYAVRLLPLPTCLFANPANLSGVPPGASIQFYARVLTSCGEVVTPTPPATWPAVCP